jgi:pentatricopeptide repeat protein
VNKIIDDPTPVSDRPAQQNTSIPKNNSNNAIDALSQETAPRTPKQLAKLISHNSIERRFHLCQHFWQEYQKSGHAFDSDVYLAYLLSLAKQKRDLQVISLFIEMKKQGYVPDTLAYNAVMSVYAHKGDLQSVLDIFTEMKERRVTAAVPTFNILMGAYMRKSQFDKAVEIYNEMKNIGLVPDTATYTTLITIFGKKHDLDRVMRLYNEMVENKVKRNTVTYNAIIGIFAKQGDQVVVDKFIQSMQTEGIKPDINTFNGLLHLLAKRVLDRREVLARVTQIRTKMKELLLAPDVITLTGLMKVYCSIDMADKAVEIYRTSVSSGFKVNIAAVNVMLNTFAAQNKVVDAERMLGDAKQSGLKPNAFTYAAMSRLSVKNFALCMQYFNEMKAAGIKPRTVNYNVLLYSCYLHNNIKVAKTLFTEMTQVEGLVPDSQTIDGLMKLSIRVEAFDYAFDLLSYVKDNNTQHTFNKDIALLFTKQVLARLMVFLPREAESTEEIRSTVIRWRSLLRGLPSKLAFEQYTTQFLEFALGHRAKLLEHWVTSRTEKRSRNTEAEDLIWKPNFSSESAQDDILNVLSETK